MPSRFKAGDAAYSKDGNRYVVDAVDGSTVYCTSSNGAEADFSEASLLTAAEWSVRGDGRRDASLTRLKQARVYTASGDAVDRNAAEQLLVKIERVRPSLLDFVAFSVAQKVLIENGDQDLAEDFSIVKARALFDGAKPEIRARMLANMLGAPVATLASGAGLGDNLLRAMVDKGMAPHDAAFEDFLDRPRR
jgi:hypothetical protein